MQNELIPDVGPEEVLRPGKPVPTAGGMLLKAAGALLLAALLLLLFGAALAAVVESDEPSQAELRGWCDGHYYDRDFAGLYELLTLYDLYDREVYGLYWEACEGYLSLTAYRQWAAAAEAGIGRFSSFPNA